jgi:hypothetical protein
MTDMITEPRDIYVEGTARFDKTITPVTNDYTNGNPRWELQISTTDPVVAQKWKDLWLLTKQDKNDPERTVVSLSRNSLKKDGSPNSPVVKFHADAVTPFTETIGYDSIVAVQLWQGPYVQKGPHGNGVKSILSAIQVLKHVKASPTAGGGFKAREAIVDEQSVEATDGLNTLHDSRTGFTSKTTINNSADKPMPF